MGADASTCWTYSKDLELMATVSTSFVASPLKWIMLGSASSVMVNTTSRFKESKTRVSKLEQFSWQKLWNVRLFSEVKSVRERINQWEHVMEKVEFSLWDPVNAFWKAIDSNWAISTWEATRISTSTREIANVGTEELGEEQRLHGLQCYSFQSTQIPTLNHKWTTLCKRSVIWMNRFKRELLKRLQLYNTTLSSFQLDKRNCVPFLKAPEWRVIVVNMEQLVTEREHDPFSPEKPPCFISREVREGRDWTVSEEKQLKQFWPNSSVFSWDRALKTSSVVEASIPRVNERGGTEPQKVESPNMRVWRLGTEFRRMPVESWNEPDWKVTDSRRGRFCSFSIAFTRL